VNVTAIAFDWGGVFTEGTFDSSAVRSLSRAFGVSQEEIAETYFPLMEAFEAGALGMPEFHERFLARSGLKLDYETFAGTFLGAVREREAMFDVLESIPERYTVSMLSNNVPVLCDRVRDDTRYRRIEHFVFSNEIGVRKPDPKAFAALSKALGKPPEETIFIDDNEANIAACLELGYQGVLLDGFESFKARWRELLPELS
jgi:FMN phosphatase YigB (HAD superfamily)